MTSALQRKANRDEIDVALSLKAEVSDMLRIKEQLEGLQERVADLFEDGRENRAMNSSQKI